MNNHYVLAPAKPILAAALLGTLVSLPVPSSLAAQEAVQAVDGGASAQIHYRKATIGGLEVFYREAGPKDAPAVLLLHGFPTSSHMYRNLIPALADRYRVIAPDYPGFGQSSAPARTAFTYSFDNYAKLIDEFSQKLGLEHYALYVMDYGAPIGFRLAAKHPERVTALVIQNGNAYDEGIQKFWDPIKKYWASGSAKDREAIRWLTSLKATTWQYTNGVPDTSLVSPDGRTVDQVGLDRPGNQEIQLDLFYDYRNNIPLYPEWQAYFRNHQPPALVIWGKNDEIFVKDGALAYKRDLPNAEIHLLDTGHFALETHGAEIAQLMRQFLGRAVLAKRDRE
jgi:pimeloyl-ACP methyl ester carboxylesterase